MAFTNLDLGYAEFPKLATFQEGNPGYINRVLDAAGEYVAWCGPCSDSGTITQIGVPVHSVTVGGDIDVRVETLDGSGFPSGTLFDTNTEATVTISSADNYSTKWVTLTAGAAVSLNTWIAVKIRANSSSVPNANFRTVSMWQLGVPYQAYNTGTPSLSEDLPLITMRYSDGSLLRQPQGLLSPIDILMSVDAFTNGNVLGNRFRLPFDASVRGFWLNGDLNADATVRLYDSDGSTVLKSLTVYSALAREDAVGYPRWMSFASDQELNANTWYRIGIVSNDATSSSLSIYQQLTETNYGGSWWMDQAENVAAAQLTEASSGSPTGEGDWSNTASQIAFIGVIMDKLTEPVPVSWDLEMKGRWRIEPTTWP